jgi:hypothetical protein
MKKLAFVAAALLLAAPAAAPAVADQPGADWISVDQVRTKLTAAGYSDITEIKADDGYWEGEGMKNGKKHEFHVDPHTGAITKDEVDD